MYERQRFDAFLRSLEWRQGEHLFIAAPTGAGKTTLASVLAARRGYVVVLVTKPRDDELRRLFADYRIVRSWPPPVGERRVLLWPTGRTASERIAAQANQFRRCLDDVGRTGGWTVLVDEAHWTSHFLRLDREIAALHHQGRSSGVTMMMLTQRPAFIPRITYTSASHAFLGRTRGDREDARALGDLGGVDSRQVAADLAQLGRHDLLYLNPMGDHRPVIVNTRE